MNKLTGILSTEGEIEAVVQDNQPTISVSITETGATGQVGPRGKDTYQHWLDQGNEGTVQDFLFSLQAGESNTYIYDQMSSDEVWYIEHPLNKYPSITIVDSANTIVYGNIEYLSRYLIKITFVGGFIGKAYLN